MGMRTPRCEAQEMPSRPQRVDEEEEEEEEDRGSRPWRRRSVVQSHADERQLTHVCPRPPWRRSTPLLSAYKSSQMA